MCDTYCFSTTAIVSERASMLGYRYIVSLVKYVYFLRYLRTQSGVAQKFFASTRLYHSIHMLLIRRNRNRLVRQICIFLNSASLCSKRQDSRTCMLEVCMHLDGPATSSSHQVFVSFFSALEQMSIRYPDFTLLLTLLMQLSPY
jgi:hypothetical protein